ncbi:MAG: formate dehydrogenase accessory protein FdhE [Bacillota bacterium]|nr:formate dehydrogenase accessory protein FdhE [Bacillota bacterium]
MKTSVVSKEYQNLQKEIAGIQEKWKNRLKPEWITTKLDKASLESGIPVLALTSFNVNIPLFLQCIEEIIELLEKYNGNLSDQLSSLKSGLNDVVAEYWVEEALSLNTLYFSGFAHENHLDEWLPQFIAETAIRPYLQLTAEMVQDQVQYGKPGVGCPVCGEPVRLAQLEEDGKKILHCPRCLCHWNASRLTCSHCGNSNHEKIQFLTIDEDPASQIQVCEECKGYTKIIDTRQYITKPIASLLDLSTIHLDFIAQENGYMAIGEKKESN